MKVGIDTAILSKVFGASSSGSTIEERARSSERQFVRGQTMLAEASATAKGRRLSAFEAFKIFGFEILAQAVDDGQVAIVPNRSEPANTIKSRREALGISREMLSKIAGIKPALLEAMETPGRVSSIREIEKIAAPLAIDERYLGLSMEKSADAELGVRFRKFLFTEKKRHSSAAIMAKLTEAAWLIARQQDLLGSIGIAEVVTERFEKSDDYGFPTFAVGYELATRAREILGIDLHSPIQSLRRLIEHDLNIPLIETELGHNLAGATISNGQRRGIVVNIEGKNENPWVRRMTLAHELGHLLWDPDQRLEKLAVDRYDAIIGEVKLTQDAVEMRANAFAVAFLAPPEEVIKIAQRADLGSPVENYVSEHFGISLTASRAHIQNVCGIRLPSVKEKPVVSDEWKAQEDRTNDYFPLRETPISRRGRFSWAVETAFVNGIISDDTAATLLMADIQGVTEASRQIIDLTS